MRMRGFALSALLLLGLLAFPLAAAGQDVDVELVLRESTFDEDGTVRIVVSLSGANLGRNLTADDVSITEAGTAIDDITVTPLDESTADPIGVALLFDVSGSTEGEPLAAAKVAADAFLAQIAEQNARASLISFAATPTLNVSLTANIDSVRAAVAGLEAGGDTALYDAVVLARDELGRSSVQRNIVIFSDGADTSSTATLEGAVTAATTVRAPITTVVLATAELDTGSLEQLAQRTGGRTITVDDTAQLSAAFEEVAEELASQFVIEYTSDIITTGELDVSLSIAADDVEASRTFTVVNPRTTAPEVVDPQSVGSPDPGILGGNLVLVLGLLAAFIAVAGIAMIIILTPKTAAAKNLERELSSYIAGNKSKTSPAMVAQALRERAATLFETTPGSSEFAKGWQKRLDQAALPLKAGELFILSIGLMALAALVGWLLADIRGAIVFAVPALVAPYLYVIVKQSQRLAKFLQQLPDTLQLMSGSLSAGYGVLQAIDLVAEEAGEPIASEFQRVLVESRLGMPIEESLEGMADRMDSDDFRWVVLAMNIQREVGGNLAELLRTVARTLRDREALRRHIKALAAEGKLSAIILVVLPFFLAGYLILVNPDYVGTLTESFFGWALIGVGVIGITIGMVWIRNLIRAIEV